jgi:chromosome segregation ATPase
LSFGVYSQSKDIDTVTREYNAVKVAYTTQHLLTIKMKNMVARLDKSLKQRIKRWASLRASIAKRTRNNFVMFISQKGFEGELEFNHEEEKLDIKVSPNKQTVGTAASTSNLSGGESSFTTVSLLLSLWTAMESPFRALDEFDVFMDAVNRRISTEMLLNEAKKSGKQFIFITPQDSSGLPAYVRVIKMIPPERAQPTLGRDDDMDDDD